MVASSRLVIGPAAATQIMSRFGLRRLLKLTGTGFAQPIPMTMIMRVPMISRCLRGFRVSLPSLAGGIVTAQPGDIAVRNLMAGDCHQTGNQHDGEFQKKVIHRLPFRRCVAAGFGGADCCPSFGWFMPVPISPLFPFCRVL